MSDQARPPVSGYPAAGNSNGYHSNQPPPSSAAPYAFAAPPPRGYNYNYDYNPYYRPADPHAGRRAIFLRRIFVGIMALALIIITVFFISWFFLRPHLPEVRADFLSVSNFNLSNNQVTANWKLQFTVWNPNKKVSLDYEHIYAEIYYDSVSLAETSVMPFYQTTKNETASKAEFAAKGSFVENWVVEMVNKEKPYIEFNVWLLARMTFRAGSWRSRGRYIRVYCGGLKVEFDGHGSSSGNLIGGRKQCRTEL